MITCPHCKTAGEHPRDFKKTQIKYRADGTRVASYQCKKCHRYLTVVLEGKSDMWGR